jgi:hypothetical protein
MEFSPTGISFFVVGALSTTMRGTADVRAVVKYFLGVFHSGRRYFTGLRVVEIGV